MAWKRFIVQSAALIPRQRIRALFDRFWGVFGVP